MVERAFSSRRCFNSSLFSVAKNEFCSPDIEHIESSFWYDMSDVRFFNMRKLCGVDVFEMDSFRYVRPTFRIGVELLLNGYVPLLFSVLYGYDDG